MDLLDTPALRPAFVFFASLAVGLLVGLERERRPETKAGVRTFALITAFGVSAPVDGAVTADMAMKISGVVTWDQTT